MINNYLILTFGCLDIYANLWIYNHVPLWSDGTIVFWQGVRYAHKLCFGYTRRDILFLCKSIIYCTSSQAHHWFSPTQYVIMYCEWCVHPPLWYSIWIYIQYEWYIYWQLSILLPLLVSSDHPNLVWSPWYHEMLLIAGCWALTSLIGTSIVLWENCTLLFLCLVIIPHH